MLQPGSRRAGSLVLGMSIAVLGACGGPGTAAPPVIGAKGGAGAATVPCPAAAELVDFVRARWALTDVKVETTCTPGRFPQAGWAVSVVVDVSDAEAWDRIVVIDAGSRAVIAESEEHGIPPWARYEGEGGATFEVVDFDGDGVDELTSRGAESHGGSSVEWLEVERLDGAAIGRALWLETHYDDAAAVDPPDVIECDIDATIVAEGATHTIVAVGKVTSQRTDLPEDCFVGRREYRLRDGAFTHTP